MGGIKKRHYRKARHKKSARTCIGTWGNWKTSTLLLPDAVVCVFWGMGHWKKWWREMKWKVNFEWSSPVGAGTLSGKDKFAEPAISNGYTRFGAALWAVCSGHRHRRTTGSKSNREIYRHNKKKRIWNIVMLCKGETWDNLIWETKSFWSPFSVFVFHASNRL